MNAHYRAREAGDKQGPVSRIQSNLIQVTDSSVAPLFKLLYNHKSRGASGEGLCETATFPRSKLPSYQRNLPDGEQHGGGRTRRTAPISRRSTMCSCPCCSCLHGGSRFPEMYGLGVFWVRPWHCVMFGRDDGAAALVTWWLSRCMWSLFQSSVCVLKCFVEPSITNSNHKEHLLIFLFPKPSSYKSAKRGRIVSSKNSCPIILTN